MQELPADLLRHAATLIAQAIGRLDVTWAPCDHCVAKRFTNVAHGHAYERLAELPRKLRTIAERLDVEAVADDPSAQEEHEDQP